MTARLNMLLFASALPSAAADWLVDRVVTPSSVHGWGGAVADPIFKAVELLQPDLTQELKEAATKEKKIEIFNKKIGLHPWFGIEQEYFLVNEEDIMILSEGGIQQGEFYCSTGCNRAIHRDVAVEHMLRCMDADLNISGINAEVAPCQWEYQIGPCSGIDAANQLWVSRWILIRTAEKYNLHVDFSPKPFEGVNGSGCHTNVSTVSMREEDSGLDYIFNAIKKLSVKHKEHMKIYGANNDKRMSGKYETSNYNIFSFDKDKPVNRGASIRIGYDTMKNKKGYFAADSAARSGFQTTAQVIMTFAPGTFKAMPIIKKKIPAVYHDSCRSILRAAAFTYVVGVFKNLISLRMIWTVLSRIR